MHGALVGVLVFVLLERGSPIKIFGALLGGSLVFFGLRGLKGVERWVLCRGRSSCVGVW